MIQKTFKLYRLLLGLAVLFNPQNLWAQTISTVAGNGTSFLAGNGPSSYLIHDGGPAINASISLPLGVAVDRYGNIFIADFHANAVRKVNASNGIISTVAGNGTAGSVAGGGLATSTPLNGPTDVAVDDNGNLYILDIGNNCIWKVNASDGIIHKIETFVSAFATEGDLTLDAAGNVYYAKSNRVMKINPNSSPTIIAGNGTSGFSGDGGLAANALVKARGIAVDASGIIYISGDNRIRKINASDGIINTIAGNGTAGYSGDGGLAINALLTSGAIEIDASNNIYITDGTNNRVRKINASNGIISTIAGNGPGGYLSSDGRSGYKGDGGLATEAWLSIPSNIAVDPNQDVYIADVYNYRIRKIDMPSGPIIITQPVAATIFAEQNANFTIAAVGTGLKYQWQEKRGNGDFVDIDDGGLYSGATSATLSLTEVPISMNGYQYRVQVSNDIVSTSSAVVLTVKALASVNTGSWQVVGNTGFSEAKVGYINLALDAAGTPFVAYADGAKSNKATVKKYTGTNWVNVGPAGFSNGEVQDINIALDANNTPFVAYVDLANGSKAKVKRYIGGNWVDVGSTALSAGRASSTSLVLGSNGNPFIAYQDEINGNKATVMEFTNDSWVAVGNPGFSAGRAPNVRIALNTDGTPFVAYIDEANNNKATVKKFTGINWVDVGNAGFSDGGAYQISIALDGSGTPYVAYWDTANGNKAIVKKFSSNSWVDVGTAVSSGQVYLTDIAFDIIGTPYISYTANENRGKATVKKFIEGKWADVGTAGISSGAATYTSIALDATGTPFVAYVDMANGDKATVMKFANAAPSVAAATNCGPGAVTLTATGAANGNYRWYTTATGGSAIPSATNATYTTPDLTATTTYYVSMVTSTTESARTAVTATINPIPDAPAVTTSFTFCQGSTATPLSATGNDLNWYTGAREGTALAAAPTPNTTTVGTTYYYVSQVVNGCESQRAKITVTVTASPTISLESFKEVCSTVDNFVLAGGLPVGGIYSGPGVDKGIFNAVVAGVGTHSITYNFTDASGCTVSVSQNITVTPCPNIKDTRAISNLSLSPNPATGKVRVTSVVQARTDLVVRIVSLDGKIVLEEIFPNVQGDFDKVIHLKGMAKGLYLLQNITNKGIIKKRLVIE